MLQVQYVALGILYLYFYVLALQKSHYQNVGPAVGAANDPVVFA